MRKTRRMLTVLLILMAAGLGCQQILNPMTSENGIAELGDQGTERGALLGATLNLYIDGVSDRMLLIHRITADWEEHGVTWQNFAARFDSVGAGAIQVDHAGWLALDVTDLISDWAAGDHENFGFLLKHEPLAEPRSIFPSREAPANRPYLEIRLATDLGEDIQRLEPLADAFIWKSMPIHNFGASTPLYAGYAHPQVYAEMQALIRFELPEISGGPNEGEDDPVDEGCTLGKGYWKTHAGRGPAKVQQDVVAALLPLWLGEPNGTHSLVVEDADAAWKVLAMQTHLPKNNGVVKLRAHLLATKLNVANGASDAEISATVSAADEFLAEHVSEDWGDLPKELRKAVRSWKALCEAFNNGEIGPGSCPELSQYVGN